MVNLWLWMHIVYEQEYLWDLLCRLPDHFQGFILQKPIHKNLWKFTTLHIESGLGGGGSRQSKYGRKSDVEKAAH